VNVTIQNLAWRSSHIRFHFDHCMDRNVGTRNCKFCKIWEYRLIHPRQLVPCAILFVVFGWRRMNQTTRRVNF